MFYKIQEQHFVEKGVPNVYRYDLRNLLCNEEYGVCTCGAKFLISRKVGEYGTTQLTTKFHKKYERCPQCGDPFGDWIANRKLFSGEKLVDAGTDFDHTGCTLRAFVDEPDGGLTVIKEHLPPVSAKCQDPKFTRYGVKIAAIPVPHVESIMVDRQEVKATKKNLAKALSGLSIKVTGHQTDGLRRTLGWAAYHLSTTSLLKTVTTLVNYPVLDTVCNKEEGNLFGSGFYLTTAIKEGEVKKGERSERKAYGLPKAVCDIFPGKVSLRSAKSVVEEFGPELAVTAIQDWASLHEGGCQSDQFMEFANFYCGLKTAERRRVTEYLTHDVAIYQGIEKPGAALAILLDYRRMCEDMEVTPELCPKSLKLQHDMAARNHRLCLDEIQKRKFAEAVAKEDYRRLAWTSADGQWAVLIPEKADDIVEEGRKQSHCVGSYVTYVTSGTYRICFLRQTVDLEKPVLTLTVNEDDCCIFYKGFDNLDATGEEKSALKQWAKARKLTLSANG